MYYVLSPSLSPSSLSLPPSLLPPSLPPSLPIASIKGSVAAKYRSYYAKDTLRDTTKKTLHRPELLHWDDKKEREDRNKNRNDLFLLYPELLVCSNIGMNMCNSSGGAVF